MSTLPFSSSAASVRTPPAWLDALRPDDELAASAYENTPAHLRALLKSAVAFYFHLWGEAPAEETRRVRSSAAGFAWARAESPVSWTLAVLDPAHASPARLLAALLPAVLAGVEPVLIVCPDHPPLPVQSVALELAGLENLYVVPTAARSAGPSLSDLVRELATRGEGRLLLFPTEQSRFAPAFRTLRETARALRLRLWQDTPAPRLALLADADEASALADRVRWAHGDAVQEAVSPKARPDRRGFDAWYAVRPDVFEEAATDFPSLLFGPGLEACWLHERLTPAFFRVARHAVRLHP